MEEKIEKILIALLESTKCGSIEWRLRDSTFNTQKCHNYRAFSVDGETHFDMEVTLNDSLTDISRNNCLFIHNERLVEGRKYVSSCDVTLQIQKLIFEKYIKPSITVTYSEEEVLDKVLNSIGDKSYMRDKKLKDILEDSDITPVSQNESSILKKIFKW